MLASRAAPRRAMAVGVLMLAATTASAFIPPVSFSCGTAPLSTSALVTRRSAGDVVAALKRGRVRGSGALALSAQGKDRASKEEMTNVREAMYPAMGRLASLLEEVLKAKMELLPFQLPEDMGYVEATYEGDRCVIQNSVWRSKAFRKIHIELATFFNKNGESTGLDVLHCVVFPDPEAVGSTVPMFGCDLVCVKNQITAAIVDLSPVSKEKILPVDYREEFDRRAAPLAEFTQPRDLPEFGKVIFSERCQFIRPADAGEEAKFVELCGEVLSLHCELAEQRLGTKHDLRSVQEAVEGQTFYCNKQSENDKTKRILIQAFGEEWTERYMSEVLFDVPTPVPTKSVA